MDNNTLFKKIISSIDELQKANSELKRENKEKDKKIKDLQRLLASLPQKQELTRLQRRINTLESELQDVINYMNRKG